MKIIYSDAHKGHGGALEMRGEGFVPMAECPERMEVILAALAAAGFRDVQAPEPHGLAEAARIHDRDFLTFLETAYPLWEQRHGASRAVFARTFPIELAVRSGPRVRHVTPTFQHQFGRAPTARRRRGAVL